MKKKWLNYTVDVILALSFISVALSGILKYQKVLHFFSGKGIVLPTSLLTLIHDWGGLILGSAVVFHLLLHTGWIWNMTKSMVRSGISAFRNLTARPVRLLIPIIAVAAVLLIAFSPPGEKGVSTIDLAPHTKAEHKGRISIRTLGTFYFDPTEIQTARPEIFNPGNFSIFDILVYLHDNGHISMRYRYDESLSTHVIESINGQKNWWYTAFYDGGWREPLAFRMDLYPFKERMYIEIHPIRQEKVGEIYRTFRDESLRLSDSGGTVIIPEVRIAGTSEYLKFENVEVSPHGLRSDIFKKGVITAMDVILSLGDQGELDYELKWYESIGTAQVVRSYFVEGINDDISQGRCGFVYESGSWDFSGFSGNHIHIPADSRVLTSPEYVTFFWICI